jgi:phosphoribosylformylglycinamidine synthase
MRDNPTCAYQEPGRLFSELTFDPKEKPKALSTRPKVAILREQGVNGQVEMAAAFTRAGFTAVDVHMSDILEGHITLEDFRVLAACGGFSYGDVLGAGQGWAQTILLNPYARAEFEAFFKRSDTLTLGVCNGCQMLSALQAIIPGADDWPRFERNTSEQFEARLVMVEILNSPSVFLKDMQGSRIPIVVSHGEGRAVNAGNANVSMAYIDNDGQRTEGYPMNPNGSPQGATAFTASDGRVTMLMPHPERVFRTVQMSWHPSDWGEDSPWMRMFYNARSWVA